jgi:ferritin-like metal-binding protein YciE
LTVADDLVISATGTTGVTYLQAEHYEISRYGTLRTWAQELGLNEGVRLLDQTLEEEKMTDATLTKIAESVVNLQAEAA